MAYNRGEVSYVFSVLRDSRRWVGNFHGLSPEALNSISPQLYISSNPSPKP